MPDFLRTGVENSQGDDAVKQETLKILDEAKVIRESVGNENAQREYEEVRLSTIGALTNLRHETRDDLESIRAELGEGGSIDVFKYAEGDITQSELGNISKEFEDLQRNNIDSVQESKNETYEPSEINENLLKTIEITNSEIIAGGEARFSEEIDLFISRYWKLSLIQQISDADYEVIESNLNALKNGSGNIHTKLLKLTQVVYKANDKIGAIGKTMISAWYGSNFIETHNHATQDIVKRVIDNSDNIFAVGYNEDDGGYYVNEGEIDKSNPMEVGTYLCSLNKSGRLNKESLLEPNGPFSPTELFTVIDKYKAGDFGGPEVQGLFIGYLDGFEDNMELIAIDYLANEQSGSHIIDFFNAKYESENKDSFSLLGDNDIESIVDRTMGEDISSIQDMDLLDEITRIRVERTSGLFVSQLAELYGNNVEIMDLLRAMSIISLEGNNDGFDYSGLNQIISEHNESFGTEYPVIQGDLLVMIEGAFNSFNTSKHLAQNLQTKIKELDRVTQVAQGVIDEISFLRRSLRSEVDLETQAEMRAQINILQMRNFRLQQQVSKTENEAQIAEDNLGDSINESESNIRSFSEYLSIFQVRSNEEILKDPKKLIGTVREKSDLIEIFKVMNEDIYDAKIINFSDIHPELQIDIDIVKLFPYDFYSGDLSALPQELFETHEDLSILIKKCLGSRSYSGKMIDLILRRFTSNHTPEDSVKAIAAVIAYEDFSIQERQQITSNIPNSIIRADTSNLFGFKDSYEKTQVISEDEFGALVTKLENSQAFSPLEKKQFDEFLEQSSLWENIAAVRLFIQAGYLGNSSFLKFELEEYSKKALIDAELDFDLHTIALDQNIGNIQYFGRSLRSNPDVIEAVAKNVVDGGSFADRYFNLLIIEDYLQLKKLYIALKENSSEEQAKKIIANNPKHYSTILELLTSGELEDSQEVILKDIISIYKEIEQESTNARNNIIESGVNIEENGEIEKALLQKISEDFGVNLDSITESETLRKILLSNEAPDSYDFRIFIELCGGDQEKAQKLLEFIAQLNIEKLIEENRKTINILSRIGVQDENNQEYSNLFIEQKLSKEKLGISLGDFSRNISRENGETPEEYKMRVSHIYCKHLGLNNEQKELLQQLIINEDRINHWIFIRDNSEIAVTTVPKEFNTRYSEYDNAKQAAGLSPFASDDEISGKAIFNTKNGKLEPNPNYQENPEREPENLNDTSLPGVSELKNRTTGEIAGTKENPVLKYAGNIINLTQKEAHAMRKNPEAMKNFIDTDTYFVNAGCPSMWRDFRKEVTLAINMSGGDIQINLNDDSLGELEFIKFAQFAYKIANGRSSKPSNKIVDLQNQFNIYGNIHAEDKSLLGDRFITDLNTIGINKELTSGQIAARFAKLANGKGLSNEVENL